MKTRWKVLIAAVVVGLVVVAGVLTPDWSVVPVPQATSVFAVDVTATVAELYKDCPGWPDCPTEGPPPTPTCLLTPTCAPILPHATFPPQPTFGPNLPPTVPPPINTNTPTPTSTRAPTRTATPTATSEASPLPTPTSPGSPLPTPTGQAKGFGPFNYVPGYDWPFSLTRLGAGLGYLGWARNNGIGAFVALTGGHSRYTDASGCFSLARWREALDGNDLAAIQPYVDDGTIVGLYAVDEPHDWGNACGPTLAELGAVCAYARERLPGVACGFNAPPGWLAPGGGGLGVDFIFAQSNFGRTSDWDAWAASQFAAASWFGGPVYLSVNVVSFDPTPAQIQAAGVALCESEAAGVMMWKWPDGFYRPGMREAMEVVAGVCANTD